MTTWNKYDLTAARRHGKPGREVRPKSITIDIHAHVAVPAAAAFVRPHLDPAKNAPRRSDAGVRAVSSSRLAHPAG